MLLPNFKRIVKSDYPKEYQDLVDRLAGSINIGFELLYNLTNGRISSDNLAVVTRDIIIAVDAAGIPLSPTNVSLNNNVRTVTGARVILAQNQTNTNTYPISAPFISFFQNGTSVQIQHVTGLQPGNQYLLRVELQGT